MLRRLHENHPSRQSRAKRRQRYRQRDDRSCLPAGARRPRRHGGVGGRRLRKPVGAVRRASRAASPVTPAVARAGHGGGLQTPCRAGRPRRGARAHDDGRADCTPERAAAAFRARHDGAQRVPAERHADARRRPRGGGQRRRRGGDGAAWHTQDAPERGAQRHDRHAAPSRHAGSRGAAVGASVRRHGVGHV